MKMNFSKKRNIGILTTIVFIIVFYIMVISNLNRFWAKNSIMHEWIIINPQNYTQTVMTISMSDMDNEVWENVSKHKRTGLLQLRDSQGRKRAEYRILDGMRHGHGILWSIDGQKIMEASYTSNQLNGTYTTWYTDGVLSHVGNFLDGQPDGEQVSWYCNGIIAREQFRTNGLLHGRSRIWDNSGGLIEDAIYDKGRPIIGFIVSEWDGESAPIVIDVDEHVYETEGDVIGF